MKLHVIGTGSSGNCYIVQDDTEALVLECGVKFKAVQAALDFNLSKVAGCLVTHEHLDHAKYIKDFIAGGIDVYCLQATADARKVDSHRMIAIKEGKQFQVGNFKVIAMPVRHDVPCVCFLIEHEKTGRFCFITDTIYCEYTFPKMNNIIVEANYSGTILQQRLDAGEEPGFLSNRILKSHMSLETCLGFLKANDLSMVNNIVLIHLSDRNSHAENFRNTVKESTSKNVHVAENNMVIGFSHSPF